MDFLPKVLYTRGESAEFLMLSTSSLDVLIAKGEINTVKRGRKVFVHIDELERAARVSFDKIWPARTEGKTTRKLPVPAAGALNPAVSKECHGQPRQTNSAMSLVRP